MRIHTKLALLTATMALGAAPAFALGPPSGTHGGNGSHGTAKKPTTPGPNASLPAKSKAYGRFCQTESKTHVAGTPGTPFSDCVTDMAKLANGSTKSPRAACKGESKKHVAATPGTPFSKCVSAGAKLLRDQTHS
jgi:hypothetical protein